MGRKDFRQGRRLIRRVPAPAGKLCGEDDHLILVPDRFRSDIFDHVCPDSLELQAFPSGQRFCRSCSEEAC